MMRPRGVVRSIKVLLPRNAEARPKEERNTLQNVSLVSCKLLYKGLKVDLTLKGKTDVFLQVYLVYFIVPQCGRRWATGASAAMSGCAAACLALAFAGRWVLPPIKMLLLRSARSFVETKISLQESTV